MDYTENLPDDIFEISNRGTGTLDYTLTDDADVTIFPSCLSGDRQLADRTRDDAYG